MSWIHTESTRPMGLSLAASDKQVFAARRNRQDNLLHLNRGGCPGTGGFSLTCRQPHANCAVAHTELFGDVAETVTFSLHAGDAVEVYDTAWTTEFFPVAPGVVETSLHPLLDKRPLELRHCPDDLEHQTPRGCAEVKIVFQAGECHAVGIEVGEGINQVPQRPAEAVNLPHEDHVKLPPMGITHEAVQLGAGLLRTAHALVNILARNLPATAGCVLTQIL